jgi:hypothetical protein
MPQLDLFTIQTQITCLFISLFFIYHFFLKYVLSSFDAYCRLKIKKVNFFKIRNIILICFSLNLKKKSIEYVHFFSDFLYDFTKMTNKNLLGNKLQNWYKNVFINIFLSKLISKKDIKIFLLNEIIPHKKFYKYNGLQTKFFVERKKVKFNNIKLKYYKQIILSFYKSKFSILSFDVKTPIELKIENDKNNIFNIFNTYFNNK